MCNGVCDVSVETKHPLVLMLILFTSTRFLPLAICIRSIKTIRVHRQYH